MTNTLQRLKELEAKASTGPWKATKIATNPMGVRFTQIAHSLSIAYPEEKTDDGTIELIIELRNSISKLLAFIEAFDDWNAKRFDDWDRKRNGHITVSSKAWDDVERARKALDEEEPK